jgi:hypothetical protein
MFDFLRDSQFCIREGTRTPGNANFGLRVRVSGIFWCLCVLLIRYPQFRHFTRILLAKIRFRVLM